MNNNKCDKTNENISYESIFLQWLQGDWKSLTELKVENIEKSPACPKILVLAASAWLQLGYKTEAENLIDHAINKGCNIDVIARTLFSGTHNILGKAFTILNNIDFAKKHFLKSCEIVMPEKDNEWTAKVRSEKQTELLTLSKSKLNNLMVKSKNYSYDWPTFILSYPRSGSNFLQNILKKSSRFANMSLYGYRFYKAEGPQKILSREPQRILSLKSHAFSPELLNDEINRIIPTIVPQKLIVIYRDPRDVMISFFNFVKSQKNIVIRQKDFLKMSFYYATFMDKHLILERKAELEPLTVANAYKKHVKNWFFFNDSKIQKLLVRYENMVNDSDKEFKKVFDFLELDCELNKAELDVKISQYSKETQNRGIAYRWKKEQNEYSELIEECNKLLKDEINILGYEKK